MKTIQQLWDYATGDDVDFTKFRTMVKELIAEAIAAHEAEEWRPYPENKPGNGIYLCQIDNNHNLPHFEVLNFNNKLREWRDINYQEWSVIAFRELPKAYQPEKGGEG